MMFMQQPSRNEPCWCGSGQKYKKCHGSFNSLQPLPPAPLKVTKREAPPRILIKTEEQIDGIRKSGVITVKILDFIQEQIKSGITTNQINDWVHELTLQHGAIPAPLNYKGFPKSVCTSINHVVCHGIPNETVLKDGDIVNVDVTSILNGYYSDASRTFCIGTVSPEAKRLVQVTKECLEIGIAAVRPGATVGDIGHTIQHHAHQQGYSVVEDFAGHGTGLYFHEEPQILHSGKPHTGPKLVPNMVFTIEPMINMGRKETRILKDHWTAVTADGSLSAQWEHTLRVTETGSEILTI